MQLQAEMSYGLVRTEAKNKERSLSEAKTFIEKRVRENVVVLQVERCEYVRYEAKDDKYEFEVDVLVTEKIL